MYTVQYRCLYREYWYDDVDGVDWNTALARAVHLFQANQGQRRIRIVGSDGMLYFQLPQ